MKKPLFLNKRLPVAARTQLFHSLILSRLLYGCAIWTDVPNALVKKLETTLMAYYGQIHDVRFWKQDHVTDDSFRQAQRLPTFRQFWARHKLTFLQHIAQFGTVFHKSLLFRELQTGRGWLFEMQDDLVWLSNLRQLPFDLPHDRPSWVEVWEALRNCRPWKAWIRRACAKHLVQEQIAWETGTQHAAILDELRSAGMQLLSDTPDGCDHKPYTCPHCQAGFATYHQRALHEFRVHDVIAEERYYVQSTICSGCLKDFHTTFRVTQHLRYRPNMCWDRIYQVKRPDEPATIQLPEHLVGVCRLPAVRRHAGPLRPTSHHRERQRIRQALISLQAEGDPDFAWWEPDPTTPLVRTCFEQFAACLQQWTQTPTEEAFHNDFFNLLFHVGVPEFQAARIFIAWIETDFQDLHSSIDPELYDVLERSHMSMLDDIHIWHLRMRKRFLQQCWNRLEQGEPKPIRAQQQRSTPYLRSHPISSHYGAMPVEEAERRRWVILQTPKVMKQIGTGPFYVVHLYSGRRREEDFHYYMQKFLDKGPQRISQSVLVISIDTAIDASMNIHDAHLWQFLLMTARAGQLLALLLGPPCETWSGARFEEQLDDKGKPMKGPRPLRGAPDLCWGLTQLSLRELLQIQVGNNLLLKGPLLCVCVACGGGAVALEHPAPPFQIERPSIWRTAILKLLSGPGMPFRQYTFQQWKHGAKGVKPTTLLFANAAIPRTFAANEQSHLVKPTTPLIGRAADGSFKTSAAKEYPAGMNFCFAEAFGLQIEARFTQYQPSDFPTEVPVLAQQLAVISACVDRDRKIMPDYQPI